MHFHRDATAVVADLDTSVVEEADVDLIGEAGHRLVDGVVDHLPDQVVQTPLAGGADVHPGSFADSFETFEDLDGVRTVNIVWGFLRGSHDRTGLLGIIRRAAGRPREHLAPVYREGRTGPTLR